MGETSRLVRVHSLARVEGEGSLRLRLKGDRVVEARLEVYEPPRFFEGFLVGRGYEEVPDITARICGICPAAYQMSSCRAMERLLGLAVDPQVERLRKMLYLGEWVESHALHVFLLHAPDFLGHEDALSMAREHPGRVEAGLRLKKFGNHVMRVVGGREIHPVNVRVGGVHRAPYPEELEVLRGEVEEAIALAEEAVRWVASFSFPDFSPPYEFLSLQGDEYPLLTGNLVSSSGLLAKETQFEEHVVERQVPHSTALHAELRGRGTYLTGPLARYNLARDRLSPRARALAEQVGLPHPCTNPFQSIVVRCVEMVHACETLARLLEEYEYPREPFVSAPVRAGTGMAATEAPRGLLYHRYEVQADGRISRARIVPPTAQNQAQIEADLVRLAPSLLALPPEEMAWRCEQLVRSYDPCISCSAHFLRVTVEEE